MISKFNKIHTRTKAVILLSFLPDPRMDKRIELLKNSFDLHVICWDRGSEMLSYPQENGYTLHVIKIDAVNDPLKRLIPYFRFCSYCKNLLNDIEPDLIDLQGLDMLRIAMAYKRMKSKSKSLRIIYEVADLHKLLIDEQKNPIRVIAQKYLRRQDSKFCKKIDLLVVTSEMYVTSYFSKIISVEKTMIFPNVPDLSMFNEYRKKDHVVPLTIGFIGCIRYKTQIKNLLLAAKSCGMNVLLAGYENGDSEIERLVADMSNVEWIGRFDFNSQVSLLYGKCDIIYSVYDADMANVRVALPNKLYESIWCEVPLIVAKETYLAQVVSNWGVGVAVDHGRPEELEAVLRSFKNNPDMFTQIEEHCRKKKNICDLEYYNEKLIDILRTWFAI